MIYCPHCNKPSAKNSGPCPHCGEDLGGREAPPPAPAVEAASGKEPIARSDGQARNEFDFDDSDGGDLELAGDDYTPPIADQPAIPSQGGAPLAEEPGEDGPQLEVIEDTPPPSPVPSVVAMEPGEGEVREVGGFGPPPGSLPEVVRYWFKVRGRLKVLAGELEEARRDHEVARERLEVISAQLGREAHEQGLCSGSMEHLVSHALRLEANLKSLLSRKAGMAAQHEESLRDLEVARREIEASMAPVRERETAAGLRVDSARTDFRRQEAKLKRAQIELRNVAGLIEQRQKEYADLEKPKEERDALLAKIAELDKQQPGIRSRIEEHGARMEELRAPLAEADAELAEIRGELSALSERMSGVRKEMEKVESMYSQAAGNVSREVDEEKREIRKGWAAVGARALAERAHEGTPLQDRGKIALTATDTLASASRKTELIGRAMDAYDKRAYAKARNIGIAVIAVLGLGVVAALVLATI